MSRCAKVLVNLLAAPVFSRSLPALWRWPNPKLPVLALRVAADGSLHGLGEFENQIDIDEDRGGECPAGEGGTILIARLLGLFGGGNHIPNAAWASCEVSDTTGIECGRPTVLIVE